MEPEFGFSSYERQRHLLRYIEREQRVTVQQVCTQFSVSPATARRDLETLAREGKVRRFHGGAMALRGMPSEPPFLSRAEEQAEEKQAIGLAAARLIADGETVVLGTGTTVLEVARNLRNGRSLTVITNFLEIMKIMADLPQVKLIGLGGIFRFEEAAFIGHITERALAELHADKVFIGVRGIDLEHGLTSAIEVETRTDQAILAAGRQVIVVADHTKCGRVAAAALAPLQAVHTLVTDSATPPDFIAALSAEGIEVVVA